MAKDLAPKPKKQLSGYAYVVLPPDGGWGWVIVVASFVCNFVAEGTMYSFGLFLEDIAKTLKTTITSVSLANSLMTGFYFLFGPIICAMINRWGYRIVGISGGILAALAFVAASFSTNVYLLIASYGLMGGIGFGMLYMPSVIALGFYFERWRGVANSISLCGSAVGSIVMPIIILKIMEALDWQTKFRIFSGFALFCAMCTTLYKPLQPIATPVPQKDNDDKSSVESTMAPHQTAFNKLNNQGFRRMSGVPQGSFHSMRLQSNYSFKSYLSTNRSVFNRSRMGSGGRPCCPWCEKQNCKHTCILLCFCCKDKCRPSPSRPMYRDDIFYTGSVIVLPEYNHTLAMDPLEYHMSMTRLATEHDISQDRKFCICCPESIRRPLSTMFDFGMFKSCAFTLVAFSGFLSMQSYFIPLTYVTAKALKHGMDEDLSDFLLSSFGIAHLLGRISCAVITYFPNTRCLQVTIGALVLAGLSTIISVIITHDYCQFTFCAIYGASYAVILSLRPIIVVELFGLEKLSNSFGIIMMFYGLGCLAGIPIAGVLYNLTKDYDLPFYFAGGSVILAGIFLVPVPIILKRERRRAMRRRIREQAAKKRKQQATSSKSAK